MTKHRFYKRQFPNNRSARYAQFEAFEHRLSSVALVKHVVVKARYAVFDQVERLLPSVFDANLELPLGRVIFVHGIGK
jgi:hypothetical protein